MLKYLSVFILFIISCGSDTEEYTWGDVSESVSDSYCTSAANCGFSVDVEQCKKHTYYHLCELDDVCDVSLDRSVEDFTLECVEAMDNLPDEECFLYLLGALPSECAKVFDNRPNQ